MTTATAINDIGRGQSGQNLTTLQKALRKWNTSLFILAFLGVVSAVGGLTTGFLTMTELIVPTTALYTTSTLLIGASFVFFGFAAHCLDKADGADKAIRLEYCRQHGLQDEAGEGKKNTK